MLAKYSAETRLQGRMDEIGCTAAFLAALDGRVSSSRLSQALRGIRNLEHADAERLLALTSALVELVDAFSPVPLNLGAPEPIRALLHLNPDDIRRTIATLFQ